jgi:RpiB/LacA/LacB family sugar-phosphate isomerase
MTVVALGADHAGFHLKEAVKHWLLGRGHQVLDLGTNGEASVDYPDFAAAVGIAVSSGQALRGVLVCGTGIGMAIAANKVPGVRAAQCNDVASAAISRQHNDTNVLALGARTTPEETALSIVDAWLETPFEGGRHSQRVDKVRALERGPARAEDRRASAR